MLLNFWVKREENKNIAAMIVKDAILVTIQGCHIQNTWSSYSIEEV